MPYVPETRTVRTSSMTSVFDGSLRDVRYALRGFRRTPVFTAVALLTLTFAIAANAAMFSLLNALVFRKVAVPDPDSLVQVSVSTIIWSEDRLSMPVLEALQREAGLFSGVAGWTGERASNVEVRSGLTRANVIGVTESYYDVLGVGAFAGRLLATSDAVAGAAPVAVIGHSFWQRAMGGDPNVIGRPVRVENLTLTVVGIAPKGFMGTGVLIEPDVTMALPSWLAIEERRPDDLRSLPELLVNVTARRASGVSFAQVEARLRARWPEIVTHAAPGASAREVKGFLTMPLVVRSGATGPDSWLRRQFTTPVLAVLAIALLILLIAVVNLASLMLLRAAAREQEVAVRLALGASRWRLVRQMLIESLLLATAAVAAGLALGVVASQTMAAMMLGNSNALGLALDTRPDARVVAFAGALALVATIVCSLAPLWRIARQDTNQTPLRHARAVARTGRLGGVLVATQVALSMVLMAHAGLFARSLHHLRSIDPGVQVDRTMTFSTVPRPAGYNGVDNDRYYPELMERVRALPGVTAAGISQLTPLASGWTFAISAVGRQDGVLTVTNAVSPGLFEALGIRLRAGRDFAWTDDSAALLVVVLSERVARRLFGDRDPLHQRIRYDTDDRRTFEVIGVVSDARTADLKDPNLNALYLPSLQMGRVANFKEIVVRGQVTPTAMSAAVGSFGRETVSRSRTLEEVIDRALAKERIMAALGGFFGGLALLLSAIGLYGVTAYAVAQRTREIGIRVALGAIASQVVAGILRRAFTIVCIGLAVGLPIAWASVTWVRSLLHGVEPRDPVVLVGTPLALLAVAALASALPARRAARVDPTVALRAE